MLIVVDYGMGNLHSVAKALEKAGGNIIVSGDPTLVAKADKLVLPGVGACADAMDELGRRKLARPILEHVNSGRKFLGICLGLQLLFEKNYEHGEHDGLGIIAGEVVRFKTTELKVPHMGWNTLEMTPGVGLFEGIPNGSYVYFVHSYYVVVKDESVIASRTTYGEEFVSAVATDNIWATQFHPEKSQQVGLKMLENFVKW